MTLILGALFLYIFGKNVLQFIGWAFSLVPILFYFAGHALRWTWAKLGLEAPSDFSR